MGVQKKFVKKGKVVCKVFKCEFWIKEVQFLRHVVNEHDIQVDPAKVEAVMR